MRSATASPATKFLPAISFVMVLSAFAFAGPTVAQDATKTNSAAAAAKQSDATSERQQRKERRQAEAAAKKEEAGKSGELVEFPKVNSTATATARAEPKMECRTQAITGSRMGKTICATPEQWKETDAAGEQAAKDMRREQTTRAGAAMDMGPYRRSSTL